MKKLNKKLLAISLSALMLAPGFISKVSYAEENSSESASSEEISQESQSEVESSSVSESSSEDSQESSSETLSSDTQLGAGTTQTGNPAAYKELDHKTYESLQALDETRAKAVVDSLNSFQNKSYKSKFKFELDLKSGEQKLKGEVKGTQTVADKTHQQADFEFKAETPDAKKYEGKASIYTTEEASYLDFDIKDVKKGALKFPYGSTDVKDVASLNEDLSKQIDLYSDLEYRVKEESDDSYEVYALLTKDKFVDLFKTALSLVVKSDKAPAGLSNQLEQIENQVVSSINEVHQYSGIETLVMPLEIKVNKSDNTVKEVKYDVNELLRLILDYTSSKDPSSPTFTVDDFKFEFSDIEFLDTKPEIIVPDEVKNNAQDISSMFPAVAGINSSSTNAPSVSSEEVTSNSDSSTTDSAESSESETETVESSSN